MNPELPPVRHAAGRPTMAGIDLRRLEKNYQALRAHLPLSTKILGIVKADGYGHGSVPIALRLERLGVDGVGVGIVAEGVCLRAAGVQCSILVLGGFWPGEEDTLIEHRLTPAIYHMDPLRRLSAAAARRGAHVKYHLKVDTGMTRLGVDPGTVLSFVTEAQALPHLEWAGFFSHLSSSDEADRSFTERQIERFRAAITDLERAGFAVPCKHLANSAALQHYPESWFDMVRPGLSLYGVAPGDAPTVLPLEPILTLKTQIMSLKAVPSQTPVSYSRRFVTARPSLIGVIPIGYADGLSRLLSNNGHVIVRDHLAPIVGAVTMDMTLVDLTDIPGVQLYDEALLIGESSSHAITAEAIARQIQTIPYEVFCGISKRVPRVYIE